MKRRFQVLLLLALLGGSFWAGSRFGRQEAPGGPPPAAGPPAAEDPKGSEAGAEADLSSLPPGTVRIAPEKQQAVGVRVGRVEKSPLPHTLRVLGRVAADENLLYRLIVASEGWVREVSPLNAGSPVKKGQPLASCFSRELVAVGQTYINALALLDRFPDSGRAELPVQQHILSKATPPRVAVKLAEDGLRSLGMGEVQIEEIKRTGQLVQYVTLVSPADGFVLARNISPSQWFDRGAELYRIADLSRVWIFADLYGREAQYLRPGMKVRASLPDQGKGFPARVSDVLPQFDPATRTLKVRLEAENPGFVMRPDMFVDLELPLQLPPAVNIPADAILDSGLSKTVFLDRGNGVFEPREVETGWRGGGRVEITAGLEAGDRIAVSGTFLIDSESKLDLAAQGMYAALGKDPVCGAQVSRRKAEKAGRKASSGGRTYYFDSEECKEKFERDPGRYAGNPARGEAPPERTPPPRPPEGKGHGHG